jgi:hypothetical protein
MNLPSPSSLFYKNPACPTFLRKVDAYIVNASRRILEVSQFPCVLQRRLKLSEEFVGVQHAVKVLEGVEIAVQGTMERQLKTVV